MRIGAGPYRRQSGAGTETVDELWEMRFSSGVNSEVLWMCSSSPTTKVSGAPEQRTIYNNLGRGGWKAPWETSNEHLQQETSEASIHGANGLWEP